MRLQTLRDMARERGIKAVDLVRNREGLPEATPRLSELQMSRRVEPLLSLIATGQVPVPDDMAPAVGRAIERLWTEGNNDASN